MHGGSGRKSALRTRGRLARRALEALVEEAITDAYGEHEQAVGFLTMIEQEVECPFTALVVGEDVVVRRFDLDREGERVVAVCRKTGRDHRIDLGSMEWGRERPRGAEWIEAYLLWRSGGEA